MSRIFKVGIEMEGGWNGDEIFPDEPKLILQGDASLPPTIALKGKACQHVGEVVSEPLPRDAVAKWIKSHYPDAIHLAPLSTDGSAGCGLHIHTSFKEKSDYAQLGSWSFYEFFLRRVTLFNASLKCPEQAHISNRLEGKNKYCVRLLKAAHQTIPRDKAASRNFRRTQLNFCFGIHGTVECRLLPMFNDSGNAVEWVNEILDIYEDWLNKEEMPALKRRIKILY